MTFVVSGNTATFSGIYAINKSTPCTFQVQVQDNGEPGSSDTFSITGVDLTPTSGTLQGGNIQIHSIED